MMHETTLSSGRILKAEPRSDDERMEMMQIGMLSQDGILLAAPEHASSRPPVPRRAVEAPGVLNEAYCYAQPSSFSRALIFDIADTQIMLISGTASVDEHGATVYEGDFRSQLWRTFRNITELLRAEDMTWHDIVRTSCYLRDIERDYDTFNEIRTSFFDWLQLDPLPASTGIQARICRTDLLVEIEAIAVKRRADKES